MPDIFISYNRDDQATARRFAEAFEREGFNVWWDATLRSGEAYDQVTEKALREAQGCCSSLVEEIRGVPLGARRGDAG